MERLTKAISVYLENNEDVGPDTLLPPLASRRHARPSLSGKLTPL